LVKISSKEIDDLLFRSRAEFSSKEEFLLSYIKLAAQYRLNIIKQDKAKIGFCSASTEIKERKGEELGFSKDDLYFINAFVRQKYDTEERLGELIDLAGFKLAKKVEGEKT